MDKQTSEMWTERSKIDSEEHKDIYIYTYTDKTGTNINLPFTNTNNRIFTQMCRKTFQLQIHIGITINKEE